MPTPALYISPAASGKTAYLVDLARHVARGGSASPDKVVTRLADPVQVRLLRARLSPSTTMLGL